MRIASREIARCSFTEGIVFDLVSSRNYWQLASRIAALNERAIVVHLSEPFYHPDKVHPHVIETNFTWSLNAIHSVKATMAFASAQILPIESTLRLLSRLSKSIDNLEAIANVFQLARVTYVELPCSSVLDVIGEIVDDAAFDSNYDKFFELYSTKLYRPPRNVTTRRGAKHPFSKLISLINSELETSNLGRLRVVKTRLFLRPSEFGLSFER